VIPPLLRENRNFRRYFIGQAASLLGDQITLIALPLTAVLALHASPAQMGALMTVALIPNLIFSLHAGSWVDRRGGRRQVMLVADLIRGLLIGTIPVAYALGHLTWAQLYLVAFALRRAVRLLLRRLRRLLPDDRRARGLRRSPTH
jgi:MFS family permease